MGGWRGAAYPRRMPSITCSDLSFAWPDGSAVFDGLSFAVGEGRSGLVGRNGTGKSTLLRLIAGELAPTRGSIQVSGRLAYLPQDFALAVDRRVDEVLGIAGNARRTAGDRAWRRPRGAVRRGA